MREGTSAASAPERTAASRAGVSTPSHSTRPSAPTRAASPRRRRSRTADQGPAITRRTPGAAPAMASMAVAAFLCGSIAPA